MSHSVFSSIALSPLTLSGSRQRGSKKSSEKFAWCSVRRNGSVFLRRTGLTSRDALSLRISLPLVLKTRFSVRASESDDGNDKKDTPPPDDDKKVSPTPIPNPSFVPSVLPKAVVETLRDQVFGFDTFFVTQQEPYQGGVLFKGNLRGADSAKVKAKLDEKLKAKFGDEYELFLLSSTEREDEGRPVAVVIPKENFTLLPALVPEWVTALAFGFVSLVTIGIATTSYEGFSQNSGFEQESFFPSLTEIFSPGALPAAAVILSTLFFHEFAHRYYAKQRGIQLSFPFFIPSWQLGSFGSITRFVSLVENRSHLVEVASAGPLAGMLSSLLLLSTSLLLPVSESSGISVDASVFHDSFLVGGLAKLFLGDSLSETSTLSLSPLTLAAWSSLLLHAINSIPVGEIDGGRVALGLWGRRAYAILSAVTFGLLGLTAIFNDIAFFWVVLVAILQRGPITPIKDEVTPPSDLAKIMGVLALLLGLLVYFPFPFPFSEVVSNTATDGMGFDSFTM